MILPSSVALAERIQKHCDHIAKEIARRVAEDDKEYDSPTERCECHAKQVLLDWFLGDYIPGAPP